MQKNEQCSMAFETLTELYGEPKWLEKAGDKDRVFEEWSKALEKYSPEQVKEACLRHFKWAKTSVFPKLAHILAQLVDEEPEPQDRTPETKSNTFMDELAQYRSRCIQDGVNGHLCFSADVDEAMRRVMDEIDAEYPPEHHWDVRTASELVNLAIINGVFWEKLNAFLSGVVEKNSPYFPTGGSDLYPVPSSFDPNNGRRKCA